MTAQSKEWQDWTDRLAALSRAQRRIADEILITVATMHAAGVPWSVIGEALGVTKQAAWEKYRPGKTF